METDRIERLLNSPGIKQHLTNIKTGNIYDRFYSLSIVKNHLQNEFQNPLATEPRTLLNEISNLHSQQMELGQELNKKYYKLMLTVDALFDRLIFEGAADIKEFDLIIVSNLKPEKYDFTDLISKVENLISRLPKTEKLCFIEYFMYNNSRDFQETEDYRHGVNFKPQSRQLLLKDIWGIQFSDRDILDSELLSCLEIPISIYNVPLNQIRDKIEAEELNPEIKSRGSARPGNSQKLVWTKEAATFYRILKALIEADCFGETGKGQGKTSLKSIIDKMNEIIQPEKVKKFNEAGYHNLNLFANDKELSEIIERLSKNIKENTPN